MPRKTSKVPLIFHHQSSCFNEAAARCRGKHIQNFPPWANVFAASMRPRPDAAENVTRIRETVRRFWPLQ